MFAQPAYQKVNGKNEWRGGEGGSFVSGGITLFGYFGTSSMFVAKKLDHIGFVTLRPT